MNHPSDQWRLNAIAILVAVSGFVTISGILFSLFHFHHFRLAGIDVHLTLLAGLSLIYLATLLNRGKRNAWLIAIPIYVYLVVRNLHHLSANIPGKHHIHLAIILNLLLPLVTLLALVYYRRLFNVRSEIRSFTTALQRSFIILLVAFVYGIAGFSLMDDHDFHQEIKPLTAAHYTIDQFGLTTPKPLVAYSKRAHVFVDSLAFISVGALFYVAVSLFSPIRFRLSHHSQDLEDIAKLLRQHSTTSEDFFMLWPADKSYFFATDRSAAIAYKAVGGVALIVGDPVGQQSGIEPLVTQFMGFCRINDWQPAFIHTESKNLELYQKLGFEAQKIGEEAIVYADHFLSTVAKTKDFRHIANKFSKLGYTTQLLEPPHTKITVQRLRTISDDWLAKPGRAERGFMMGYFNEDYIQRCALMVARDPEGIIQAFVNQVPSPTANEANFDFLRNSSAAPGNINDFLMLGFIAHLHEQKVSRLNMGLSALAGLEKATDSTSRLLNTFLSFAYVNGNRIFSFKGLNRFKSKYEPQWEDRYIIYEGGIPGFSKTINSLMRAMRVRSSRQ